MDKTENRRQYRVLDQTLTMHAILRDKFKRRALLLNLSLLLSSVFLCALAFVDQSIFSWLGLEPKAVNFSIGAFSVLCFAISLVENRVDWQGQAALHAEAFKKLASLKADFRNARHNKDNEEELLQLSKKYNSVMDGIVEIPELSFAKLKAMHLRKMLLSKRISEYPATPVLLLKIQLIIGGVFSSFGSKTQNPRENKNDFS